jgi:Na+/H+ antiporter NhaD/arsenite permease-like protein
MAALLFGLFLAVLVGVAVWHERAIAIAAAGLGVILALRLALTPFDLGAHVLREWAKLANLFGLLVGFELLADHFERSHLTERLALRLPAGALGAFALLALVWLLSAVLDNIAAAVIGATIAGRLYDRRVHVGYLAALVAAANAGGAGSVIGDTTTTMMWIDGVRPAQVLPAYVGSVAAIATFGIGGSIQQARHAPRAPRPAAVAPIDWPRLGLVVAALAVVVAVNVAVNAWAPDRAEVFPWLALALWVVLVAGTLVRPPSWDIVPRSAGSSAFLLALVFAASLMPVESLPSPSWRMTLVLGFVSSIFDNIPLTRMALDQGGYDPALLAYAVGVGGSMVWFGSSAGVAVSGGFPEARSIVKWLRAGWHVPVGFVVGFFALLAARGLGR